jgi:hypothetical protein
MQIPGLNLLKGTVSFSGGTALPVGDPSSFRPSTPTDLLTSIAISSELPVTPILSREDYSGHAELDTTLNRAEAVEQKSEIHVAQETNGESSKIALDALDIALEAQSEPSPASSDHEEFHESDRYSPHNLHSDLL